MKIVINRCYGGISLSEAGTRAYWARKGREVYLETSRGFPEYFDVATPQVDPLGKGDYAWYSQHNLYAGAIPRNDSDLVSIVEELGAKASGEHADLEAVEIPDNIDWEISEDAGGEHVTEKHRTGVDT